jgi:hypothetical protein
MECLRPLAALLAGLGMAWGTGAAVAGGPSPCPNGACGHRPGCAHQHARGPHGHGHAKGECHPCVPGVHIDQCPDPGEGFRAKRPFRPCDNTFERAGNPQCLSPHAQPTDDGCYVPYYVGGGTPLHGGPPCFPKQGTFGWDYNGIALRRGVILGWTYGRRYQGGTRGYTNDLPFEVPDVFASKPFAHLHADEEGGER